MLQLGCRNGFAERIALIGGTPLHTEKGELISRFHPLGHDVMIEATPHPDDCPHNRRITLSELEILDEARSEDDASPVLACLHGQNDRHRPS